MVPMQAICTLTLATISASAILFLLFPIAVPAGYDVLRQTISDGAAQATPNGWIARLGLSLMGLAALLTAMAVSRSFAPGGLLLACFGLCMLASSVWSRRPWLEGVAWDNQADQLHSLSAQGAGIAFTWAALLLMWHRWNVRSVVDPWATSAAATAILCPLLMLAAPSIGGLAQRLMFAVALAWLADSSKMGNAACSA